MTLLLAAMLCLLQQAPNSPAPAASPGAPATQSPLERKYKGGEKLTYHMTGSNSGRNGTLHYEIQADGVVKKDEHGYYEEFAWSGLVVDGKPVELPPASRDLRQVLSLEPNPRLAMPDLSKVHPMMIGPITDLLTFYADMLIAKNQGKLTKAGDSFYFRHGTPNSWADGAYVTLGQDSIDFDVALTEVNETAKIATVVARHVPPEKPQIKIPAAWMQVPVADAPNNWIEVSKVGNKFSASVGKEIFVAVIKVSLVDGRIISASLANPVEVLQRQCDDAALTVCGEPVRYQILREVEIK